VTAVMTRRGVVTVLHHRRAMVAGGRTGWEHCPKRRAETVLRRAARSEALDRLILGGRGKR
jgi:hypothetical protein